MWVEQTPNGSFKFCERFLHPNTGKNIKLSITLSKNTAATRKEAAMLLQQKFDDKFSKETTDLSLKDLRELYLEWQKKQVKLSTYKRNLGSTKSIMNLLGQDIYVSSLTAGYVKKCFVQSGRDNSTLNEFLKRFKAWMNWAYKNDYLEDVSFLKKIDNFKEDMTRIDRIQNKFLEEEEALAIINHLRRKGLYHHAYFTRFMLLTGLRVNELVALEKSDIDYDEGVIHITKSFDCRNLIVTSPKTRSSIRDIPLTPDLIALIKEIRSYYRKEKLVTLRNSLLFKNSAGNYYNLYSLNKVLKNAAKACDIEKKVTSHVLRHTYASLLMEKGIPVDTISRLLGHETSKITKAIYLHVTKKLQAKDFDMIRELKII